MSKAILVIDMPKKCYECSLMSNDMYCKAYAYIVKGRKLCVEDDVLHGERNSVCPLKPMPQRKMVGEIEKVDDFMKSDIQIINEKVTARMMLDTELLLASGYNLCIDEILGGNNEEANIKKEANRF